MDVRAMVREILQEMAPPAPHLASMDWYHGAASDRIASIIADGHLKPSDLVKKGSRAMMAPQHGKVYLTHDIVEGIGYAFFRAGSHLKHGKPTDGKAYLVIVDGGALRDVEPDEDIIADLIPDFPDNMENGHHKYQWLRDLAARKAPKAFQRYETYP